MQFALRLLGGFELRRDGVAVAIASPKQRCLLASLAHALPDRCDRETLADRLWGDDGAGQSLRTALTQIRKQVGTDSFILGKGTELWLDPEMIELDTQQFVAHIARADSDSLRSAAELYRGDFLSGVRVPGGEAERWISDLRGWFRDRALELHVRLSQASLAEGRLEDAVNQARRAVMLDDLAEEAHRALLRALLSANRRGEAMRHTRAMIDLFRSALGVLPSSETMEVVEEVRQDGASPVAPTPQPASTPVRSPEPAPPASAQSTNQLALRRSLVALSYEITGTAEALRDMVDPEALASLAGDFDRIVQACAEEWLGTARILAPDHGLIYFGAGGETEDYASDAVTAAIELSEAMSNYRWRGNPKLRFQIKAGLDESPSLILNPDEPSSGKIVAAAELAARNMRLHTASPGILVSEGLRARVSSYFKFRPVRLAAAQTAWLLAEQRRMPDRFAAAHRRVVPLIGRRGETELILTRWSDVLAGHGQMIVMRGEAGIGKSRLVHEIQARLRATGVRPMILQCNPGDSRTPFSPLANLFGRRRGWRAPQRTVFARAIRRFGAASTREVEQLAVSSGIVPLGDSGSSLSERETTRLTRHGLLSILEARAAKSPLVVIIEDVHWADPSTLSELEALPRWIADWPVMIVATCRDDALAALTGFENAIELKLRPLAAEDSKALAASLWELTAEAHGPRDEISFIADCSEGVPLFAEELVLWRQRSQASIGTSPALHDSGVSDPAMPLNDLLLSHINASADGRKIAQLASVLGRSFDFSMLSELAAGILPADGLADLAEQMVAQRIFRRIWPPPHAEYEFRHVLLREAAYGTLREADRRVLHKRVFDLLERQGDDGGPTRDAALAWHAERGGEYHLAAKILAKAGRGSAARGAMAEARATLSQALDLVDKIDDIDERQRLELGIVAALGPLVTARFGPRDPLAQSLYSRGVDIARQRPKEELAGWFPVFWGWWYTGADFRTMRDRAARVKEMLSGVADPEIILQINHCAWAIDFNLGHHRETLEAIDTGLGFYDPERARLNRALFGGHDAKVCGLGQKSLSLWLTGMTTESDSALASMIRFVGETDHVPSRAHSLDTEAVSAFYRDDYDCLADVSERMKELARQEEMQFLAGQALLFGGWAMARGKGSGEGHDTFNRGFDILQKLGSVVDLPLYLEMKAALLLAAGRLDAALEIITEAISRSMETGHSYWLPELYRRRAEIAGAMRMDRHAIAADLGLALSTAHDQGALALVRRSEEAASRLGLAGALDDQA